MNEILNSWTVQLLVLKEPAKLNSVYSFKFYPWKARLPITYPTTLRSVQVVSPQKPIWIFLFIHSLHVKCSPRLFPLRHYNVNNMLLGKENKPRTSSLLNFYPKSTKIPDDYVLAPNIFSIIIAVFSLHTKMYISSHAPSRKLQITVMRAGQLCLNPQYWTCFTSSFLHLTFGGGS